MSAREGSEYTNKDFYLVWYESADEPWYSTPDEEGQPLARLYTRQSHAEKFLTTMVSSRNKPSEFSVRRVRIVPYEKVGDVEDEPEAPEPDAEALLAELRAKPEPAEKKEWKEPPPDDLGMMKR